MRGGVKIGYKRGFRDGHDDGYKAGYERAEVELASEALAYRNQGYLNALGLVADALKAIKGPKELAEVADEIKDVLNQAAPGQ